MRWDPVLPGRVWVSSSPQPRRPLLCSLSGVSGDASGSPPGTPSLRGGEDHARESFVRKVNALYTEECLGCFRLL